MTDNGTYSDPHVAPSTVAPCGWREPHEAHIKPGALRAYCGGVAAEYPSERHHSARCANRRLTDHVMGVGFGCVCDLSGFTDDELGAELARRRAERAAHRNANLTGCQSRLRWAGGTAAKCRLEVGHEGVHSNRHRWWTDADSEASYARFG